MVGQFIKRDEQQRQGKWITTLAITARCLGCMGACNRHTTTAATADSTILPETIARSEMGQLRPSGGCALHWPMIPQNGAGSYCMNRNTVYGFVRVLLP